MRPGLLLFADELLVITYWARLAGIEPATTRLEGGCSIRLSYRRI